MKGLAAKKHDTFADMDVTDLEETVALPVMKKSPPSSPRKRKTVKSTARSTRKKTAKS
jgi:hypothetical protein